MKVNLDINPKYYQSVKDTLEILLPEVELHYIEEEIDGVTVICELDTSDGIEVNSYLKGDNPLEENIKDKEILADIYSEDDFSKRIKERLKLSLYRLLSKYLKKKISPWGILVGVRPTKIGHYLLDRGLDYQTIDNYLEDIYGVSKKKRDLLLGVIKLERNYLPNPKDAKNKVSIYVGIPFCPTRCNYCSFASYPIEKNRRYMPDFLESLCYEIEKIGKVVNELGLEVDTLYIGGGTPTVLSTRELDKLIRLLKEYFVHPKLREFTVEAGRADTIDKAKLELLKDHGVKRVSINPQTMNQVTLDQIGRRHTVEEVIESFNLAREIGFDNINMDIIIGLPDEDISDVKHTLKEIEKLKPDSFTVHTLAIKRASRLKKNLDDTDLSSAREVEEMIYLTEELAKNLGLIPYYMYRQKHILGNLENVGYAKPGEESIYNIIMMEERETVIGLGGGAITKLINPENWSLERLYNPKFPEQYSSEIEERTIQKISKLRRFYIK
ncbi:coproporphyrinogen dehydrogenase HemZ [Orenia metallireducens]|uniref:Coproporphyrinogen dehydrogenase HemZ n=1 Tax=Orenia metallireducens TaxID=1413210 RepID=A0A1C0A4S0_9FIRM|nr:coproporphyrinogen dehydrogenase HemZ [Orenia metallireducens]OCL25142.1 coproporphyrinogen dehydrogenase HemZ [Orenia metallireducens]